jgi:hypothetical protein
MAPAKPIPTYFDIDGNGALPPFHEYIRTLNAKTVARTFDPVLIPSDKLFVSSHDIDCMRHSDFDVLYATQNKNSTHEINAATTDASIVISTRLVIKAAAIEDITERIPNENATVFDVFFASISQVFIFTVHLEKKTYPVHV